MLGSRLFDLTATLRNVDLSEPSLKALILCQPDAVTFGGSRLSEFQDLLPDQIAPARVLSSEEIGSELFSPHLRLSDVPLAFHRGSLGSSLLEIAPMPMHARVASPTASTSSHSTRTMAELFDRLEAYGRMLQYLFSDDTLIMANQILYHPYAKLLPRHLLPLNLNIREDIFVSLSYTLEAPPATNPTRPTWQVQADKTILSILFAAQRMQRQAEVDERNDSRGPNEIHLCFDELKAYRPRPSLKLRSLEIDQARWGPWWLRTDLGSESHAAKKILPAEPPSEATDSARHESGLAVHYGRARLEIDPHRWPDHRGLTRSFQVNHEQRILRFHSYDEQLQRLKIHLPRSERNQTPNPAINNIGSEAATPMIPTPALGFSLHLSGHAAIQVTASEIGEILRKDGQELVVHPKSELIQKENVRPRLFLTSDGTFKLNTLITTETGAQFDLHGLPQANFYILLALQYGLSAMTGLSNAQIAHSRRGMKRERDLKVLRNLGYAMMIFYDAAQFALGQPLSSGETASNEHEVCRSIFQRLGALILKAEGWPVQTGSLIELCSPNVVNLVEGFVAQVVHDLRGNADEPHGRKINIYLPQGELQVTGLARAVTLLFHALVTDLVLETDGACFTRARTKYFESFMNGRSLNEREDLAVTKAIAPEEASRYIYQPGVNERFVLPESSRPPKGFSLFSLLRHGFEIAIDGKAIEEFSADDFRPEFTLREDSPSQSNDFVAIGVQKINWFELHPKFFFRGSEITTEQVSRLSKDGMIEFQGKLYRVRPDEMPSLKRLTQFWRSIQSNNSGLTRGKRRSTEETYFQLPRSQTLELLALRANGVKVRGGPRWDAVTQFYDSLSRERPPLVMPNSFHAQLQPYQAGGVQWLSDLYRLGLGGILADDMGLGKTVTTLAFFETLRSTDALGACLVLVPTSLTYNWLSECERFTPELKALIFQSREPEAALDFLQTHRQGVIICTYGLLQEHNELLQQVDWNIIAFDEAQNLKNITTKRTTAARKLRSNFKVCLTGTPLENHYGEFYSLFDLIVPGSLGELSEFREKYVNPPRVLREDLDHLKLKARPLVLRRTKAQVMAQLPPKIESTIKLPFEDEQKRIYRDIATAYNEQIRAQIATHGEAKMQLQMLTALLRLRQACSDPAAIPGVRYLGEPPKVTTLTEALLEVVESGASALVFTQFLTTFERIRSKLSEAKIRHYDMSGADSRLSREKKLKLFQADKEGAVFVMTLKTGGVGLNLTKASYVFHIEPWWNPAVENQATDRVHRIGQKEAVQVYRYIIKESVEEKIEILKDVKSKRFDALFSSSESAQELERAAGATALSQADFEFLLS